MLFGPLQQLNKYPLELTQ